MHRVQSLQQNLIFKSLWRHRVVYRAPYYPVDGAIEYIFNVIQLLLHLRLREIKTTEDFIRILEHCK